MHRMGIVGMAQGADTRCNRRGRYHPGGGVQRGYVRVRATGASGDRTPGRTKGTTPQAARERFDQAIDHRGDAGGAFPNARIADRMDPPLRLERSGAQARHERAEIHHRTAGSGCTRATRETPRMHSAINPAAMGSMGCNRDRLGAPEAMRSRGQTERRRSMIYTVLGWRTLIVLAAVYSVWWERQCCL